MDAAARPRPAQAIIHAIGSEDPPLRLPLGTMAIDHILAALDAESKELDAWAHVSAATDFPQSSAQARA